MSVKSVVRVSVAVLGLLGLAASQAPAPGGSPAPPQASPGKDPLLEFVPREHIPADSAVSFPVDI
jgi:hypothetical protein